jgi:hypothetical protein
MLGRAVFSTALLTFEGNYPRKSQSRASWFKNVMSDLENCDIVFADPDNGLCEDSKYRYASKSYWKRIPLSEAKALSENRSAIIYHHNTRRAGGHAKEIQHWLREFDCDGIALYWRPFSPRTYFMIHPTADNGR